ncbi:MAG: hypothetical protein H7Z74_10830 [Anaerolineae bacterium]|nr:hypothetical protein [Gemmatimonadaceae bacterium]
MKNPIARIALAILLLGTLGCSGCRSVPPMPGATQVAAWQKAYRALKCWNPRGLYDMPSTEPLLFAMTRICLKVPGPQDPEKGYQTLVAIDAARNEVRAVRMKSVYSGGVHYTGSGDIIWYSSGNTGEAALTQRYVEAFTLRKAENQEVSLGRIELPFVAGPGVWSLRGEDCNLLSVSNYLKDNHTPRLSEHFLVSDSAPFTGARRVEQRIRPLFWNPAGRYFVVQREAAVQDGTAAPRARADRFALDCGGREVPIEAPLKARLSQVQDPGARFLLSSRGDLLVTAERSEMSWQILVFRGEAVDVIPAREIYGDCHELPCEPFELPLDAVAWSKSGEHFMVDTSFNEVRVYRTSDLKIVANWKMKDWGDFPAHGFLSDRAAFELSKHSRMTFYEW